MATRLQGWAQRLGAGVRRFHADQAGSQGLEKLLIIAAIVLPLLGLLIILRNEVRTWVVDMWRKATEEASQNEGDFLGGKLN